MKILRPKSAKIGPRLNQQNYEELTAKEINNQNEHHKETNYNQQKQKQTPIANQFKYLMKKPIQLIYGGQFSRLIPKNFYQDKQQLYSEAIQLKFNLNETINENLKLKTKITILEKQLQKTKKVLTENQTKTKINNSVNNFLIKQNTVGNIKKILAEAKQEIIYLKSQNAKIKKSIKYTKLHQIQIEKRSLLNQTVRLRQMIQQILTNQKFRGNISYFSDQGNELKKKQNQQIKEKSQKNEALIADLSQKFKSNERLKSIKQKALQKQLKLTKKKLQTCIMDQENLRKQLLKMHNAHLQSNSMKQFNDNRVNSSKEKIAAVVKKNPIKANKIPNGRNQIAAKLKKLQDPQYLLNNQINKRQESFKKSRQHIQNHNQSKENSKKQYNAFQYDNIMEVKNRNKNIQDKQQNNNNRRNYSKEQDQRIQYVNPRKKNSEKKVNNINISNKIQKSIENIINRNLEQQQNELLNHYKNNPVKLSQQKSHIKQSQKNQNSIQHLKDQFSDNSKSHQNTEIKSNSVTVQNITNHQIQSIKQILTYRFKIQHHTYEQLQKDIYNSFQNTFTVQQINQKLKQKPFKLNNSQVQIIVEFIFNKRQLNNYLWIHTQELLNKLKYLIGQIRMFNEQQIRRRINQLINQQELKNQIEKRKSGKNTIGKQQLTQILQRFNLNKQQIEYIIALLSMDSQTLQFLNYSNLFTILDDKHIKKCSQLKQYKNNIEQQFNEANYLYDNFQEQKIENNKNVAIKNNNNQQIMKQQVYDEFEKNEQNEIEEYKNQDFNELDYVNHNQNKIIQKLMQNQQQFNQLNYIQHNNLTKQKSKIPSKFNLTKHIEQQEDYQLDYANQLRQSFSMKGDKNNNDQIIDNQIISDGEV